MNTFRLVTVLVAAFGAVSGCRDKGYSQATPQDTLATARLMVEQGDARRLTELVYAESPDLRGFLDQAGDVLTSLADLGIAVQQAFPKQVADIRAEAEAAAKEGKATSFVAQVVGLRTQAGRAARTPGDPAAAGGTQQLLDKMFMEVAADPYAWLTRSAERVTLSPLTDDTAALLLDGKPALGVGVTLIQREGKWYFYLPVEILKAGHLYPDTPEKWEIAGCMLTVIDQAVTDMTADVRAGKARRLEDVARAAGEKAVIPVIMTGFAYSKILEADRKQRRAAAKGAPGR